MTDRFQQLLVELGAVFHLPLSADHFGACSLRFPSKLVVQLQLDASQENLVLFSLIGPVAPGRFRENMLREALKTNAAPDPRPGILAYIARLDQLVLFQSYPLLILNGDRLSVLFGNFLDMAELWSKALQNGQAPPPSLGSSSPRPFGLRP
ncbi:MAG: CesT family type III secretion system chaperone [Chlamydiia bacterium]|nr:CesT family type III secretion system chaperone [Chlamydiia bacterium]